MNALKKYFIAPISVLKTLEQWNFKINWLLTNKVNGNLDEN